MTHDEVSLATQRALGENSVLERMERHPCPGCGRHVISGSCYRCRGAATASRFDGGAGPAADPFGTVEADARMEGRSDCRQAVELVVAHLTPRGILDADPDQIADLHEVEPGQIREALRAIRAARPPSRLKSWSKRIRRRPGSPPGP